MAPVRVQNELLRIQAVFSPLVVEKLPFSARLNTESLTAFKAPIITTVVADLG